VGVDGLGRDIQLVQEVSPCLGFLVLVDASDVPLRVFIGELVEVRQLAAAGLTPQGPHVDDRGFTVQGCAKVGGLLLAAAEAGQLDAGELGVWGGLRSTVRGGTVSGIFNADWLCGAGIRVRVALAAGVTWRTGGRTGAADHARFSLLLGLRAGLFAGL